MTATTDAHRSDERSVAALLAGERSRPTSNGSQDPASHPDGDVEVMARPWRLGVIGAGLTLALAARLFVVNSVIESQGVAALLAAAFGVGAIGVGLCALASERDRFGPTTALFALTTAASVATLQWISPDFGPNVLGWDPSLHRLLILVGFANGLVLAGLVLLGLVRRRPTLSTIAALGAGLCALAAHSVLLWSGWLSAGALIVSFALLLLSWDQAPRRETAFTAQSNSPRLPRAALGLLTLVICGAALQLWLGARNDLDVNGLAPLAAISLIAFALGGLLAIRRELQQRATPFSEWRAWIQEIRSGDFQFDFDEYRGTPNVDGVAGPSAATSPSSAPVHEEVARANAAGLPGAAGLAGAGAAAAASAGAVAGQPDDRPPIVYTDHDGQGLLFGWDALKALDLVLPDERAAAGEPIATDAEPEPEAQDVQVHPDQASLFDPLLAPGGGRRPSRRRVDRPKPTQASPAAGRDRHLRQPDPDLRAVGASGAVFQSLTGSKPAVAPVSAPGASAASAPAAPVSATSDTTVAHPGPNAPAAAASATPGSTTPDATALPDQATAEASPAPASPAPANPAPANPAPANPAPANPAPANPAPASPAPATASAATAEASPAPATASTAEASPAPATASAAVAPTGPAPLEQLADWLAAPHERGLVAAIEAIPLATFEQLEADTRQRHIDAITFTLGKASPTPALAVQVDGPYVFIAWDDLPRSHWTALHQALLAALGQPVTIDGTVIEPDPAVALLNAGSPLSLDDAIDRSITGLLWARGLTSPDTASADPS